MNSFAIDAAAEARPATARAWARTIACTLAFAGALICLYSVRQADPDFFGYLAYGRLFVESGGLTTQDPFAYTSSGHQWVTFEYGAHLVLWWAYHYTGPAGLIALKCLLGGSALAFLFLAIRTTTDEPFVWVPMFLLSTSAVSRFFVFRPQLFTFAFFALFVWVLFRFLLRGRAPLWVLPLAMIAWTNTHGGFVAGLGVVGLAIVVRATNNLSATDGDVRRFVDGTGRLWLTLAACGAATFVNPLGVRLWQYVVMELLHGTNRRYIAEWRPVSFSTDAWSTIVLGLITVILATVGWAACRQARGIRPHPIYWIASCVPLIAMAYFSVRHVPLAAMWVAPVVTLLATPLQQRLRERAMFRRAWFLLRGLALLPACLTCTVVYAEPQPVIRTGGAILGATHPCGAVNFLREHGYRGNLYNPLWWGGYVTWELYPQVLVSMDGRNISLFPDEMVVENLKFFTARDADVTVPLRYRTDLLLVPANAPVLARLKADPSWRQLYADRGATLFQRSDVAPLTPAAPAVSEGCSGVLR